MAEVAPEVEEEEEVSGTVEADSVAPRAVEAVATGPTIFMAARAEVTTVAELVVAADPATATMATAKAATAVGILIPRVMDRCQRMARVMATLARATDHRGTEAAPQLRATGNIRSINILIDYLSFV